MDRDPSQNSRLKSGLGLAAFACVFAVLSVRAVTRVNQLGVQFPETDPVNWALRDFRDAIYYPIQAIRDGISPYDVAAFTANYPVGQDFPPYSPLTFVLHWPFAWMPFQVSQWAYFGASIAMTLVLSWAVLWVGRLPKNAGTIFGLAAAILATRPGQMNLLLGQTTNLLVLCSLFGLHFARTRPWLAGLFLAIATFKPTYGPLLILFAAALGQRRAAWAGVSIAVLITAPLVLWVVSIQGGWSESWSIMHENSQALYENPGRDPAHSFSRIDALSLWARIAHTEPNRIAEPLTTIAIVAVTCLVLYFTGRRNDFRSATSPGASLALLAMLIAAYHHAYDALVLVPILVFAGLKCDEFWRAWPAGARWIWCGLVAIPLANYVATNSGISAWQISGEAWTIVTCVNGFAILVAATWLAVAMLRSSGKME